MKTLLGEEELRQGVRRVAEEIRAHFENRPLTILGVTAGSVVFLADLIRLLDMPLRVGLVQARAYRYHEVRPGPLVIHTDMLSPDVRDRNVLLVDDIYDTGERLLEIVPLIDDLNPASVRTAVLLRKEGRAKVALEPDFVAFDIPNEFAVGYGLDYGDLYRNLPYVAALEPEDMVEESGA